jgi:dipeptidyl aminopeptidase/acylaminoacyl peptidase
MLFAASCVLALLCAASCKKGDAEIQRVYRDYRQAIFDGDRDALLALLSRAKREEFPAADAAAALSLIRAFVPPDAVVASVKVEGAAATLSAEGTLQGAKARGTVRFVREDGAWKVDKEDWEATVDGTPTAGPAAAVEPFYTSPQSPPARVRTLEGHQGEVSALAYTPDGRHLVSASYGDFSIRTWDLADGRETSSVRTESRVRSIALSADRGKILAADASGAVTTYAFEEGWIGAAVATLENAGDSIALSPDARFMAVTAFRKPVDIWEVESGAIVKTLKESFDVRVLAFAPTGKSLAGGGDGSAVAVWDVGRWRSRVARLSRVDRGSSVASLDFSPDGRYLATGHTDSSIVILDLKQGKELHNWFVQDASTLAVKFSPEGSSLATAHEDKAVYVWDRETGYLQAKLEGHAQPVASLAFSPDGRVLATGGRDRRIILWTASAAGVAEEPAAPEAETPPAGADEGQGASGPEFLEFEGRPNLVRNPSANRQLGEWRTDGEAGVERSEEGDPYFAIRYGGMLFQDVPLAGSGGRTVLLVALAASERVDEDGDQTGLPYLSGEMASEVDDRDITAHLSARTLMHAVKTPGEWGTVWGVFRVPPGTGSLRLFLGQADGGKPQTGSAAWFDDVGVFLFDSDEEARAFVPLYEKRYAPYPRPMPSE